MTLCSAVFHRGNCGTSAPNVGKMALNTTKSKIALIHTVHRLRLSKSRAIFRQSGPNDAKIIFIIIYLKYLPTFYTMNTYPPSSKVQSVSLYDRPFFKYNFVDNWKYMYTEWPHNEFVHLTTKGTLYILNIVTSRCPVKRQSVSLYKQPFSRYNISGSVKNDIEHFNFQKAPVNTEYMPPRPALPSHRFQILANIS